MRKIFALLLFASSHAFAQDAEEWEPFRRTHLFETKSPLWIAPDMARETVGAFSTRLLESARQGEAMAMATLGRVFYVRGDTGRAGEWLTKAAEAGHGGAQLDLGALCAQGIGRPQDFVEAYKWMWLATWQDAPGAEVALREISQKLNGAQILDGVQRAAQFQAAQKKPANPAAAGR